MKYIPGEGPTGAKILLLKECPDFKDELSGKLFTHPGELRSMLLSAGIHLENCWRTAVSKYYVPANDNPRKKIPFAIRAKNHGVDLQEQLADLQREISSIEPNLILGLGKSALWALTGKTNIESYRGSILQGMGRKFIPTYNPEHLSWQAKDIEFKGYWNKQIILCDFKRAAEESRTSEFNLPRRHLHVAKSLYEVQEFFNQYKSNTKMSVDIEAHGTMIPACIGFAFNKHHGICVPLWNSGGISTIPDSQMVAIWILIAKMLWEKDIIGQNFNYDRDKIKRLGFIIRRLVSDVMMKAHAINPELSKSLAFLTSIYTKEPFYKNEGMYQGKIEDLFIGCARDACVTFEIDESLEPELDEIKQRKFFENFLMLLPEMYADIENQGFRVNPVTRDQLLHKYIEWNEKVRYELFQLVGTEVNVNSPKQVSILLFDNFKLPRRSGTGEEEITALLNTKLVKDETQRRVLELILEGRRVRKSISTYLMAMPDYDSRMRTTYYMCLDTGRTATGQQDPPIRPLIEVRDENNKKKMKTLGIAFQTMTKHGDIGADIRSMYVPDSEDEVFVQADSSQAEARVVWLLADDEEALKLVDTLDYHALTASWFFGGSESDYSKKILGYEHPIRFAGKTLRHAGHLGAGKKRAAISVNTDARKYKIPLQIDEYTAGKALTIFHSKQPRIQQVFQAGIEECIKKDRTLIAGLPWGIDSPYGGRRTFRDRMGEELLRQAFSYIPQRSISDNTKAAGLRIRARIRNIKIAMESHDALLFCIKRVDLDEQIPIIRQEMERPINFSNCSLPRRSLKIPCDIEIGTNYMDFKKFIPVITKKLEIVDNRPNIQQQFEVINIPPDSRLDELLYRNEEKKFNVE